MRKLVLIAHISLDGFVAGPNGELDGFPKDEANLGFVCELTREADAALMGRISYQILNPYWPSAKDQPGVTQYEVEYSNWYNCAQKIVASRTITADGLHNTVVIADDLAGKVAYIKQQPGKDILLFGSPSVAQLLMREHLIDEYWVFVNPILFGKGIPLFAGSIERTRLKFVRDRVFENGEVGLLYVQD